MGRQTHDPRHLGARTRTPWNRAGFLVLVLALAGLTLGAGAQAAEPKVYAADIVLHNVARGATQVFSATLVNQSQQQQIGSANITAPAGFALVGQPTISTGTVRINGNVVELRSLSLPPGAAVTATFSAVAPQETGVYAWGVAAKQANNFSGPPGNDIPLNQAASDLSVTVWENGRAVSCGAAPCDLEVDVSVSAMTARVKGPAAAGGVLFLGLNDDALSCGDSYLHAPLTVTVDFIGMAEKTVVMTIPKPGKGPSQFQVCYQSEPSGNGFTDRDGNLIAPGGTGLLRDCASELGPAPCVLSKKMQGGSLVITLLTETFRFR